jgi:hypothetical protein
MHSSRYVRIYLSLRSSGWKAYILNTEWRVQAKRRYSSFRLHDVTCQRTVVFVFVAVRTSIARRNAQIFEILSFEFYVAHVRGLRFCFLHK